MKPELLSISGGYARQGLRIFWRVGYTVAAPFGKTQARRVSYTFAEGYTWRKRAAHRKVHDVKLECLEKLRADGRVLVGEPE